MDKKREDYLKEAGTKPEDYQSEFDPQIQQMAQDLVDRKPFTYDFNADPLYQQYRDQYTQAGQQAMLDTMGNAASLSGGYGNSYAATAGNQAYGQYMTQLNNVIPQLYDAAYNRYVNEENTLRNNLTMLQGLDDTAYGRWMDQNNLYWQRMNFYNSNFEGDRTNDLSERQFGYQQERDKVADDQWNQQFTYNQERDKVADSQWNQQFTYNQERDKVADSQWNQQFTYNQERDKVADSQWNQQFTYNQQQDALNRQAESEQATAQAAAQQMEGYYDYMDRVRDSGASKEKLATVIEGLGLSPEDTVSLLNAYDAYDAWYNVYGGGEEEEKEEEKSKKSDSKNKKYSGGGGSFNGKGASGSF